MSETRQLVKMANQIADNFAFHDDCEDRLVDHIQRFWAPSMRDKLGAHIRSGATEVSPVVASALERVLRR